MSDPADGGDGDGEEDVPVTYSIEGDVLAQIRARQPGAAAALTAVAGVPVTSGVPAAAPAP